MKRSVLSMLLALVMVLTLIPSTSMAESIRTSDTEEHVHDYSYDSTLVFPTCNQGGYTIYECECGASYEGNYTEALGHSYVNGSCERCNAPDPDSENPVERPTSGTCGENVVWSFDEATGTLTISGEGPMDDYSGQITLPWQDFIQDIRSLVVKPGVTTVGNTTLSGAMRLERVELPEGITSIGNAAFDLTLALKEIKLPSTLTEIGELAFSYGGLTKINIPASVRTIGPKAFWFMDSLKEIRFEGDAPEFLEHGVFLGVTATAYYPAGNPTWTEEIRAFCEGEITWVAVEMADVTRIAGADRIETSLKIADHLKATLAVEKFSTVIVASALNFPDALTGSYLAAVKDAPILLTREAAHVEVCSYIEANLAPGGTVYILGGESAVSADFESSLTAEGITAKRLAGSDRFGTNLAILEEAGVTAEQEILICTATGFADSLSASAAKLPILLVHNTLSADQQAFLATTSGKFVIIGGEAAVSAQLEAELDTLGDVARVGGANRYETSVLVAERFVFQPNAVILAYARNYPDGLCGGPLAVSMNAALILTDNYDPTVADAYVEGLTSGIVVGGAGLISDETVRDVFDLSPEAEISAK